MVYQAHSFTHAGWSFTVEAEGWPTEELAAAAMIDMQVWTMRLTPIQTAALHDALSDEREALVYGLDYDRDMEPLPAVREAQRRAVESGLGGQQIEGEKPTVTLEAFQTASSL